MRQDLSSAQQAVQACHAVVEATREFLTPGMAHPYMVLCGVKNEAELAREWERLKAYGVRVAAFHEPDRNGELTAVATEPLSGEARRPMRRYKLLCGSDSDGGGDTETDAINGPYARGPP